MKMKIGSMTLDVLPPVKRYMNAIERRLNTDRKTRTRIMMELASDFQSRRENGQSDEAIMKELGSPAEVAAEFNAAFGAKPAPSRRRWAFVALAAVVVLIAALQPLLTQFLARIWWSPETVGVIGGADGPTAIYVTDNASQSPAWALPWLLGCAAGFLLPVWRDPHARSGYGAPLLLCGLGLLPLFIVTLMTFSLSFSGMLSAAEIGPLFVSLAAGFFTNGEWLCAVVLVWALAARRRASREKGGGKKES